MADIGMAHGNQITPRNLTALLSLRVALGLTVVSTLGCANRPLEHDAQAHGYSAAYEVRFPDSEGSEGNIGESESSTTTPASALRLDLRDELERALKDSASAASIDNLGDHPDVVLSQLPISSEQAHATQRAVVLKDAFNEVNRALFSGARLDEVDCREYPCIVFADLEGDQPLAASVG